MKKRNIFGELKDKGNYKKEFRNEIKRVIKDAHPSLSNKDIKKILASYLIKL